MSKRKTPKSMGTSWGRTFITSILRSLLNIQSLTHGKTHRTTLEYENDRESMIL